MDIKTIYNCIAEKYDSTYQQDRFLLDEQQAAKYLRALQPYGSVLSLGCGTGQDIEIGDIPSKDFVGLDISTSMLSVAKAKYPNYNFVEWNCEYLYDYQADTVIGMFGVINYTSLNKFLDQINHSKAKKFLGIIFSPIYVPELGSELSQYYSLDDIEYIMKAKNISYNIAGLYPDLPMSENNYWVIYSK